MADMEYVELKSIESAAHEAPDDEAPDLAALVDSTLRFSPPEETSRDEKSDGSASSSSIDPRDRIHLDKLYAQLAAQYLDPIAQFIRVVRRGDRSAQTMANFRNLFIPLIQLTESMERHEERELLEHFIRHIDEMARYKGVFTWKHFEPMNSLFDLFLNSLGPEIRDQYLSTCYYQRNSNPLLEEIRRVKYIGPKRLQRLYSVGLVTVEAISRASAQEIVDVTGISLKLARQVIEVTRNFMVQQRRNRAARLRGLSDDLREELAALQRADWDLYGTMASELHSLGPQIERILAWIEAGPPADSPETARR